MAENTRSFHALPAPNTSEYKSDPFEGRKMYMTHTDCACGKAFMVRSNVLFSCFIIFRYVCSVVFDRCLFKYWVMLVLQTSGSGFTNWIWIYKPVIWI